MNKTVLMTAIIIVNAGVWAAVTGPYTVDSYTLHLYHMDGSANDAALSSPLNLALSNATVSAGSFTDFGTALDTYTGGDTAIAYTDEKAVSNFVGADGAFTFEAIVRPMTSAITNHMEIISGDDDEDPGRGWQFRINTSGLLEFNNILVAGDRFMAALPAGTVGSWYHAAVTYTGQAGTAGNLKFYWTSLDEGCDEATLLASFQMSADIPNYAIDFAAGNEARNAPGENFEGYIDEVRISSIAREPNDMLFAYIGLPRPIIVSHPASVTVMASETASFQAVFESESAPVVQWFKGYPLGDIELTPADPDISINTIYDAGEGRYTTTLSIRNTLIGSDSGSYYCMVNNASNLPVSSGQSVLTILGLAAHWTLDEDYFASNEYLDIAGGHDAAAAGIPVFVTGADGIAHHAVQVTPTAGWASVHDFNPSTTGELTISIWVNWEETPGSTDDLAISAQDGQVSIAEPNGLSADAQWQHVCMVFDGTTGKLYTDGVLRAQGPFTLPSGLTSVLEIGSTGSGGEAFNGSIDDLRIYNYTLEDADITAIYNGMVGGCGLPYDLSGPAGQPDCVVDIYDLAVFAAQWLNAYYYSDFADLSRNWLSSGLL